MAITITKIEELAGWLTGHKCLIMVCDVCEIRQYFFVAPSRREDTIEFLLEHMLCSGDEVDIVTGKPVS